MHSSRNCVQHIRAIIRSNEPFFYSIKDLIDEVRAYARTENGEPLKMDKTLYIVQDAISKDPGILCRKDASRYTGPLDLRLYSNEHGIEELDSDLREMRLI